MKNSSLAIVLALALGMPLAAVAQGSTTAVELTQEHFDQLDVDKDGQVSRAEYQQYMEGAFGRLDADGNGRITKQEAARVLTPEQFAAVDADGSSDISEAEFMDRVMRDFDRQDRDKDGRLAYH